MKLKILALVCCVLVGISCKDNALSISYETQLAMDVGAIDEYLANNGITAQSHVSGLRYVIQVQGTGEQATSGHCIQVNYTGKLLGSSEQFETGTAMRIALSRTILGWRIGLKELRQGGKMTLYIPSGLGYGTTGSNRNADGEQVVTPNQNLIFDVELTNLTTYNSAAGYCNPWP